MTVGVEIAAAAGTAATFVAGVVVFERARTDGWKCKRHDDTPCCGLDGIRKLFQRQQPVDDSESDGGGDVNDTNIADSDDFQELVRFLATVPLLHEQLDAADLPKIAHVMSRVELDAEQTLIRQGEESQAFFIVEKGKASCVAVGDDNEISGRATLLPGDYVGAKALSGRKKAFATVKAEGKLVVLRMLRADFEGLGLEKKLKLTKRPAVYKGQRVDRMRSYATLTKAKTADIDQTPLTEDELEFCYKAISNNPNLRAVRDVSNEVVRKVAAGAIKRNLRKDEVVYRAGDLGWELFVVVSGSLDVFSEELNDDGMRSAEAQIMHNTMTTRVIRKRNFLASMLTMGTAHTSGHSMSQVYTQSSRQFFRVRAMSDCKNTIFEQEGSQLVKVGARVRVPQGLGPNRETVGKVIDTSQVSAGIVTVEFRDRTEQVEVDCLNPVVESKLLATYSPGECFGELALLYNTRRIGTVHATKDSQVFVITQEHFKESFGLCQRSVQEWRDLLAEVPLLAPLLNFEREELARNANGYVTFRPGERVLHQDQDCEEEQWYILKEGTCVISKSDPSGTVELARLGRGGHFGEHAILLEQSKHSFSVDAGQEGMTCLTIDGALMNNLNLNLQERDSVLDVAQLDPAVGDAATRRRGSNKAQPQVWHSRSVRGHQSLKLTNLHYVSTIGHGGFGKVYLVQDPDTRNRYALKQMSKGYIVEANTTKQVSNERGIMSILDCPFIVKCYRTMKDEEYVYFLLEHAPGGHLHDLLNYHYDLMMKDVPRGAASMFYSASIALALDYLHERYIAYRDLKLENVLLDREGRVKLCDMGFARLVLGKTNTFVGTPEYMAPEIIDFPHNHGPQVDWWALGVLTCELLSGQPPWDVEASEDPMDQIMDIRRLHEKGIPKNLIENKLHNAKSYVSKLLTVNPRKRLGSRKGVAELKEHAWFKSLEFDWEALSQGSLRAPYKPTVDEEDSDGVSFIKMMTLKKCDTDLFCSYTDDGTGWDELF